ncbi:MAG TPA: carboxypeptidase regulatory-like domain-containing protein [Candidatus Angelobacter sp.]|nr:carboxypeptidase regulatory-like domain-containing protein [Candidatus Angelobacter sp.]
MRMRPSNWAALLFFFLPGLLLAQITTSTIVGTIADPSGAVVPHAQVTATNTATGFARAAQSNDQGEYRIEFLPVGEYSVEASADGFKKTVRKNVVLEVDQIARVDVSMAVGAASESVEISAAVPLVNTSNVELGRTVENVELIDLPIVNRNAYSLLTLTPGVQRNDNSIVLGYPEQRTLINGGVDGGAGSVNYYLDGGANMTSLRNTGNILPNPDAIQEFRVQTNNYNAEYGRFANGVINVLTKSGTNDFHGSLFEFVQNTILDANDWGNSSGTPPLHRNRFGGTVGGPILKNRTFFFGSYAGLREVTNTFLNGAIVPTALERAGDFSLSAVKPVDPTTGKPFLNNRIPLTRQDTVALNIVNQFIPAANLGANKWQGFIPSPYDADEFLAKVDHDLNQNNRITASYFETSGTNTIRAGAGNLPWSRQRFDWRQHDLNLSDTWTIGPNKVNQVWINFTRNFGGRLNVPGTSLADLGSSFTPQGTPSMPQLTVNGFFNLTQAISGPVAGTNFYGLRDTFSYTHGRHALKFGVEMSLDKDVQQTLLNNYGVFTFNGVVTKNALADFELGLPSSLSQDAPSFGFTNTWYTGLFVQDDFRIHPRLTLNLGLRWDIQTAPTDPHNQESTYVPGAHSTVNPTAPLGILFPGDPGIGRGIVSTAWTHVSPRIGIAWDPFGDGKTAVRAGAGVFYGSLSGNQWNTTANFEPFATRLTFTNNNSATNKGAGATLTNPYRGLVGGDPFPYRGQFIPGGSIFGPSPNFHWPYVYQLNFSVQRQLTNSLSVMASYVGSLSHDLPFAVDLNYPSLVGATANNFQARRPNPAFGQVLSMQSGQTASYNGLQISAAQRVWRRWQFNAFYEYSKTFDSVQLQNNTTQGLVQDFANVAGDRGPADTDMRHHVVVSMIWEPSYYGGGNRILQNVLNGWSVSPILNVHSGTPFTVLNGADANLDGNNNDRAQLVGDPLTGTCPNGLHVGAALCWFNTSAFAKNTPTNGAPIDGNSPRNLLYQPGYKDVDLAIFRTFRFGERIDFQLRGEASNVFNMASLNAPNATVATGTFGQITSAQPTRRLQIGLRLTY